MFDSEEIVWHNKFGKGMVAASSGPVTYVLWDNPKLNQLKEVAMEDILDEEGDKVGTESSEIEGEYIYIDSDDIDWAKQQEAYKDAERTAQFLTSGWYLVKKVSPQFAFKFDETQQRYRPIPLKNRYVLNLQSVETGEKLMNFPVRNTEYYVPTRVVTDSLQSLLEDFSFRNPAEKTEEAEPEKSEEPEIQPKVSEQESGEQQ